MACTMASMPVAAVTWAGSPRVRSASSRARSGSRIGDTTPILVVAPVVMIAIWVTSEPVPAVVGTATIGALIGAGGYGQPILTGIRLDDIGLILEGAIPAALLALIVQGGFDLSERIVVPRGLRMERGT